MELFKILSKANFKYNKKINIVIVIGIILSSLLLTASISLFSSLHKSLLDYLKEVNGDYHLYLRNVEVADLDTIKNTKGIKEVNIINPLGYSLFQNKNEYKPYAYVLSFSDDSFNNLGIKLLEGKFPSNDKEIIIPSHLKDYGSVSLSLGEIITLNIGNRFRDDEYLFQDSEYFKNREEVIKDSEEYEYTVVGIYERPNLLIEGVDAPGYTFITSNVSNDNKVDLYLSYNQYGMNNFYDITSSFLGISSKEFKSISNIYNYKDDLLDQYNDINERCKYYYSINYELLLLETNIFNNPFLKILVIVIGIVSFIILLTSYFCIRNAFQISVLEKTKLFGTLKSIGTKNSTLLKYIFFENSILSLIGIPIGILLGNLFTYLLIILGNNINISDYKLVFYIPFLYVLLVFLLVLITIYISGIKSILNTLKIDPIKSIKLNNDIKYKNIKVPKYITKLFGNCSLISYKNFYRNKKRYTSTIVAITLSCFVFIVVGYFTSSTKELVNRVLVNDRYNIEYSVNTLSKDKIIDKVNKTLDLKDYYKEVYTYKRNVQFLNDVDYTDQYIKALRSFGYTNSEQQIKNHNTRLDLIILDDKEYEDYIKKLGLSYVQYKDKVIYVDHILVNELKDNNINSKYISKYTYDKDSVIEVTNLGELHNINKSIKIDYKTNIYPDYISDKDVPVIILSNSYYCGGFTTYVKYVTDKPDILQEKISNIYGDTPYDITNKDKDIKNANNLYFLIKVFLYGFIFLVTLISITNIFNIVITSLELRKMEFMTYRSIGLNNKQFNYIIYLEIFLILIRAVIISLVLSLLCNYGIYKLLFSKVGLSYIIPYKEILGTIIFVFTFIFITMKYSVYKLNKYDVMDILRKENV